MVTRLRLLLIVLFAATSLSAQTWRTVRAYAGAGVPSAALCSDEIYVGITYKDTGAGGKTYVCAYTAGLAYAWEEIGAGGAGDVTGPAVTTENKVPQWDSTTKKLKDGLTLGTAANNLVQLNGSAQLPAISAALLTNFPTLNQSTTGNADTATALAANPTDCGTGEFANAIAANGNLTCAVPAAGTGIGLAVTKTAAAVLTIATGNARFGSTAYVIAGGTATITAGTGTAYIYISSAGVLTVAHNVTVTCSGCTATAGTSFPTDSIPLYTWTATSTVWDTAGGTDYRAALSTKKISAGTGVTVTPASGHDTVAVDTSTVPTFSSASMIRPIGYAFDGGGSALTTGHSPVIVSTVACTLVSWDASVDAGTITFKVWKIASGTAVPTISNVINTSGVGISSNTSIHSTTMTDFTTAAVAAYDRIIIAITAAATATQASLILGCQQ